EPRRRGHFYRNEGPPDYKLSDMTWYWGSNIHGPWCAARIDFDHDGDLDVLVCSSHKGALLFRNDLPHLGNWLAFRISGNPADNVPMDGIGTKIIVYAGNQKFYRDLQGSAAGSRCLQNSFELHFGLGQVTPDSVVIIYPNGKRNKLTGIAVNQRYRIPYMQNAMPYSLATPALVAPKNFAIRVSQIDKLKWTTCSGAEKYMIQIADDNKFVKIVINDSTANNEYLAMSLESNRTYYWRVMAKSSGVQSLWSSVWNFTLGVPRPNAPTLLSPADASKNQPSQPQFQWSESTYNINYNFITKYDFQISSDNQFINYVIEYNNLTVTKLIIDSVLTASVTYYWRVRGTNESQPGEWSQPWSFVTGPLPAKPTLTEPANDAKDLTLKPTFRWSGETGSTGYEIQISKDSQFNSNAFEKSQMKLNRLTLTDPLDINTKYYWHIRTHNEFGAGQWSDSWSFTTGNGTGVEDYYTTQDKFAITAIIPNPFSEKTTIHFQMYIAGEIILSIYDLSGCEVFSGKFHFSEGEHFIDWQPDNLSKGLYIFRIRSGFHEEAGKLMFY
ncbi:MAG: large repetitive protein, partial [Bacteroidota bacterium]|nr:large repetitive protein [Bacteroidota bacterium]